MKVRVSIGNLVPKIRVEGDTRSMPFGILNRKAFEKGLSQISPVGGAALMTSYGKQILENAYGAVFQEDMDARFVISDSKLEGVLQLFEMRDPSIYELDPTREVVEELSTNELPVQNSSIFTPVEVAAATLEYVKTVRQVPRQLGGSAREVSNMPTYRLFNLFVITVPQSHLEKLFASPVVRFITDEQVSQIQAGIPQQTPDGWEIGSNFLW